MLTEKLKSIGYGICIGIGGVLIVATIAGLSYIFALWLNLNG